MEIERFHDSLCQAVERVASYGPQWQAAAREYRAVFQELGRPALRDAIVNRLDYIAQAENGFRGSFFIAGVAEVAERILGRIGGEVRR